MEAYESRCPDCGKTYTWVGYKTGIGKTPEQLAQMKRDRTVCRYCGSTKLQTGLDHKSEAGRRQDAACGFLAELLLGKKGGEK